MAAKALKADHVIAAMLAEWAYDEETRRWWFVVMTRYAATNGLRATYLRIRQVLKAARLAEKLPLQQVVVLEPAKAKGTASGLLRALGLVR